MFQKFETKFTVAINSVQEMVTVRETLKALGYPVFHSFQTCNNFQGYQYVAYDGRDISRTGPSGRGFGLKFGSLQECLDAHFRVPSKQEQRILEIKAEIATLKQELQGLEDF